MNAVPAIVESPVARQLSTSDLASAGIRQNVIASAFAPISLHPASPNNGREFLKGAYHRLLHSFMKSRHKKISAMMRVRNEQEFIVPAVRSILPIVDEIVIIDNMSDDTTPKLIAELAAAAPDRIKSYTYSHRIARYGDENRRLALTQQGLRSPALLANFYNWCLAQCSHPYVLKWDGDTVATPWCTDVISRFRNSSVECLWHTGVNLHADRRHLIAGRPTEDLEPRLFPRLLARYDNSMEYCETLRSPFLTDNTGVYNVCCDLPLYVHLKFCKNDRFSNISEDLRQVEVGQDRPGPAIDTSVYETIVAWNLGAA